MASAMAESWFRTRLVGASLSLVTLSACSQEPVSAKVEIKTSEPAQEQRAGAPVDCREEVAAAFEQLRTRPYREDSVDVISDYQTAYAIIEFLPPDRVRMIAHNGVGGYGTDETIWVGQRVWSNYSGWPWGWHKRDARRPPVADRSFRPEAEFECLGKVAFEDSAYIGYRAPATVVVETDFGRRLEASPSLQALRKAQRPWITILIDPQSRLPAYRLVARKDQLDSPRHKVRYTYPNDIKIEPPLWCRVGLCPGRP